MITGTYILNLEIEQGTAPELEFVFENDFDMSDYSYVAKLVELDTGTAAATFSATFSSGAKTLKLSLSAVQTAALTVGKNYVWDCIQKISDVPKGRLIAGTANVVKVHSV